jgi:hypothetical protein
MKVNCDGAIEGWSFPKIDSEKWEILQQNVKVMAPLPAGADVETGGEA